MRTVNFLMFKLVLVKAEEPEIFIYWDRVLIQSILLKSFLGGLSGSYTEGGNL